MRVYAEYRAASTADEIMVVRLLALESIVSSGSSVVNCYWSFPAGVPQFSATTPFESVTKLQYDCVKVDIARCRKFVVLTGEGPEYLADGTPIFCDVSSRPVSMGDVF